ncbi:MAG: hypothetical protein JNJ57_21060, partial [Saprospiraceae bacterium]|nr:hypothetical protein [Saprospiraceae bacterium]
SSLYGPTSWHINPEFFSSQLYELFPHLDTVDKQLKLVVGLLHLMGKVVGLDVIPHVDRFAEHSLANPSYFEWIRRVQDQIVAHHSTLHEDVERMLFEHLKIVGDAVGQTSLPDKPDTFFNDWPEQKRLEFMFGWPYDYHGRLERRKAMVDLLFQAGLETLPATMGPPYRGIEVDPDPKAVNIDDQGRIWRDYRIIEPQKFSRVFGPLARYKLYEPFNENRDWQLNFEAPVRQVWAYVSSHYNSIVEAFDFDFMRGDMSHVQMRPEGVPTTTGTYYDLLAEVKMRILEKRPYFGYFAESFLAPPGEMAYGDECDHLEASLADTSLGDLQSEPVGTEQFVKEFARYNNLLTYRRFAPNFTLMTADKDDPRFDAYYLNGNETRYFIGLFLCDMPSYMSLGFECRDQHLTPAPNEHYTKLYVFQESKGPKATKGPWIWGKNLQLYEQLNRMKAISNDIHEVIQSSDTQWLLPPDSSGVSKVIAWTQKLEQRFIFAANLSQSSMEEINLELTLNEWKCVFSTHFSEPNLRFEGQASGRLEAGECLIWMRIS